MNIDFLVTLLAGSIAEAGKAKLVEVLQDLHDSNEPDWKGAIMGGRALILHLRGPVDKTKTKIDNIFVDALDDAITTSAKANHFPLED